MADADRSAAGVRAERLPRVAPPGEGPWTAGAPARPRPGPAARAAPGRRFRPRHREGPTPGADCRPGGGGSGPPSTGWRHDPCPGPLRAGGSVPCVGPPRAAEHPAGATNLVRARPASPIPLGASGGTGAGAPPPQGRPGTGEYRVATPPSCPARPAPGVPSRASGGAGRRCPAVPVGPGPLVLSRMPERPEARSRLPSRTGRRGTVPPRAGPAWSPQAKRADLSVKTLSFPRRVISPHAHPPRFPRRHHVRCR